MTNPVAEALAKAGERVGTALTEDGAKAISDLYEETGMRANRVVKRVGETDGEFAERIKILVDDGNKLGDLSTKRTNPARTFQQDQLRAHFVSILNPASDIQHVEVDSRKYPETAAHIKEAQGGAIWSGSTWTAGAKPPALLTIDRNGATANRGASLSGIPTGPAGTDRDEYPPAMFKEGGAGASVKYVDGSDNRGAGSSIGGQLKYFPDGTRVKITVL